MAGVLLGLAIAVGFDQTMSFTNTERFCLSCHNHAIPDEEYKLSKHFSNRSGVSATCADCHVPHGFSPKIIRKIAASKEVLGHFTGVINTNEKYMAHREEMKRHEIDRLVANDSQECRYCHNEVRMDFSSQSRKARKEHKDDEGKTCIECHSGLVHTP
jgi:cytochrome c-type protein NapC